MILHADSNSFYANCERLFRPDLRGKPVVVLSNNDGIIVALTQEAKNLGLKRGDPFFKVRDFCSASGVEAFSSNYALYADISRRITSIYLEYAPEIEEYSIDESFLFFPDFSISEITEICHTLHDRILKEIGMPVCVGAAPTKTMAKWYNKHAKNHGGVYVYDKTTFDSELAETPVKDIWGIGRAKTERLKSLGITNGLELKHMSLDLAKKVLTVSGVATVQELNGIKAIDRVLRVRKEAVTSSRQFGKRVFDLETMECALASYTESAVEKIRLQNCEAGVVTVYISTCFDFDERNNPYVRFADGASKKLWPRTSFLPAVQEAAKECLRSIWRSGYGFKTVVVTLSDLAEYGSESDLFADSQKEESRRKLMDSCEKINRKYGRGTLQLCLAKSKTGWEMKRERISNCWTTRMEDLPECF